MVIFHVPGMLILRSHLHHATETQKWVLLFLLVSLIELGSGMRLLNFKFKFTVKFNFIKIAAR